MIYSVIVSCPKGYGMESISERTDNLIHNNILINWLGETVPNLPQVILPVFSNQIVVSILSALAPIIPFLFLLGLIFLGRFIYNLVKSLQEPSVFLELTPPALTEKTSYTTEQLFKVFHDLGKRKPLIDKILGRKVRFSFEIVSSQNMGIRYLIRTTPKKASNIKRHLLSYLPFAKIEIVNEYLPKDIGKLATFYTKIAEYKLSKHFAFPLQKQNVLDESDPVAYITGMMTKLSPGELVSFQIVISPTQPREVQKINNMILRNEDVLGYLNSFRAPVWLKPFELTLKLVIKVITIVGSNIQWAVAELMHPSTTPVYSSSKYLYQNQLHMAYTRPARQLSSFEEEAVKSVQQKIKQPLFETSIRLLAMMKDRDSLKERVDGFVSPLAVFGASEYQDIDQKRNFFPIIIDKLKLASFQKRLLSVFLNNSSSLLSVSEISDLYHFPFARVTETENIVKSFSKELPAPISLKQNTEFDVVFAQNMYGGETTPIGLTSAQRARHMVIFGGTGNGKTTLILEMIRQDMINGKGIGFIDPHGDAALTALSMVPKEREKDVVWVDPDDIDYPLALNLMELTPGLSINEALREKELVAESIVSLFRRICASEFSSSGNNAFRIEHILRNTIYTAFTIKDATLFTIYDLLQDPALLKEAVLKLDNKRLQNFWKNEFGKAGDYQLVKMIGGVTARIGRFLNSEAARRILEQPKSSINFDEIMDNKKLLICNLSKGKLSEDISQVLGTTIITKIQLATMRRAKVPEDERVPFFIYVDEFQNFATPSFIEMLSEARKYKLNIVISEQSTSQQSEKSMISNILANTAIVVCFRTANPEDERIMLTQFKPLVKEGEINNLPWFHFFIKVYAQVPQEPFSGETIPLQVKYDKEKIERIVKLSRQKYAKEYKATNTQITRNEIDEETEKEQTQTRTQQKRANRFRKEATKKSGLPGEE